MWTKNFNLEFFMKLPISKGSFKNDVMHIRAFLTPQSQVTHIYAISLKYHTQVSHFYAISLMYQCHKITIAPLPPPYLFDVIFLMFINIVSYFIIWDGGGGGRGFNVCEMLIEYQTKVTMHFLIENTFYINILLNQPLNRTSLAE